MRKPQVLVPDRSGTCTTVRVGCFEFKFEHFFEAFS